MDVESSVTSVKVRDDLESLLERDLLGPWDGPEEELPPGVIPAERYLLGRLVPMSSQPPEEPSDAEDAAPDFADPQLVDREVILDSEDATEVESQAAVRTGSMAASALGLSFMVPADVDAITVTARWGRYERKPSEVHVTEQGRKRVVWRRHPAGGTVEVRLSEGNTGPYIPDPEQDAVVLACTVRERDHGRGRFRVVHLALVNGLPRLTAAPDANRLYQAELEVTAVDGAAPVFLGNNDPDLMPPPSTHDPETLRLSMLHRRTRKFATGRQCAVDAELRPRENRAWRLLTTCFPSADVAQVVAGGAGEAPGLVLDMNRLGNPELAADDLVSALRPLALGYRKWLGAQQAAAEADAELAAYRPAPQEALLDAEDVADRLDRAIDLLRDDGLAREAFRFANQAMARQRIRGELVRHRGRRPEATVPQLLTELDVPRNRSWRPFQLAFVLLCLPGLVDPGHPDAHRGMNDGQVQLLFFPTGGGKTEAYLGLTAFTLAIRRLQGVVGLGEDARDGSDGVAVLMRYTLRLLTAQQFQRAAALVCACEWLRRERIAGGDHRWGSVPFRLGLWVGSSVTPNSYEEAKRQAFEATERGTTTAGGPLQLTACPWCGSRLEAGRDLEPIDARRRIVLYCGDADGSCTFSRRRSPGEGLPVVTVDEEVYRLTPALVISTVDKFAQLPWKGGTAPLFGLVDSACPRHGWRTPDTAAWCRGKHPATAHEPAAEARASMRLRPPDLIIQDELHLISDALGSLVGLFESVIDRLATRTEHGHCVRPVLVASTATVRRARDQVQQVFDRDLMVFPPQVLDAAETFFSTRIEPDASAPGRRYRGICAPGERMKSIAIRVMSAVMEHAQAQLDRHGDAADPYMTLVGYFTSTRELAGTRRLVDDDIAERLNSQQVRTRRRRPAISELTSRMPSSRITATLADLERPFEAAYDSNPAIDAWKDLDEEAKEAARARERPVDVLLATSMLQVGVDVPRLGLMIVAGQPKNTAEYIQATSRVGRDPSRPGLVLTIFQWNRPRDLAHYESFGYDHATFGQRVEGVTTTPFSDRALDRGLSAVLAAAIRHSSVAALDNISAGNSPLTGLQVDALVEEIGGRAERVTGDRPWGEEVRRQIRHRLDHWAHQRRTLVTGRLGYQDADGVTGLLEEPGTGTWELWSAPLSLREVEPEVLLQLDRQDPSHSAAPEWTYDDKDPVTP